MKDYKDIHEACKVGQLVLSGADTLDMPYHLSDYNLEISPVDMYSVVGHTDPCIDPMNTFVPWLPDECVLDNSEFFFLGTMYPVREDAVGWNINCDTITEMVRDVLIKVGVVYI